MNIIDILIKKMKSNDKPVIEDDFVMGFFDDGTETPNNEDDTHDQQTLTK